MYPSLLIDILKLTKRNHKNIDYIYEQTEKHGQMKHLSYILTSISTPIACFKNQKITSSRYADFRRQRRALLPKQKVKASVIVTTIWNFSQSPDKKVINIVMSIAILWCIYLFAAIKITISILMEIYDTSITVV